MPEPSGAPVATSWAAEQAEAKRTVPGAADRVSQLLAHEPSGFVLAENQRQKITVEQLAEGGFRIVALGNVHDGIRTPLFVLNVEGDKVLANNWGVMREQPARDLFRLAFDGIAGIRIEAREDALRIQQTAKLEARGLTTSKLALSHLTRMLDEQHDSFYIEDGGQTFSFERTDSRPPKISVHLTQKETDSALRGALVLCEFHVSEREITGPCAEGSVLEQEQGRLLKLCELLDWAEKARERHERNGEQLGQFFSVERALAVLDAMLPPTQQISEMDRESRIQFNRSSDGVPRILVFEEGGNKPGDAGREILQQLTLTPPDTLSLTVFRDRSAVYTTGQMLRVLSDLTLKYIRLAKNEPALREALLAASGALTFPDPAELAS